MLKHLPSRKRAERVPGFYGEICLSFESIETPNPQLCKAHSLTIPCTRRATHNKAILLAVKIYLAAASTIIATGLTFSA